jgi:hypothetical protein
MRIYNPRLGRFLSVDPIFKKYPELTPYQFASNSPILFIDLDGLEGKTPIIWDYSKAISTGAAWYMYRTNVKPAYNAFVRPVLQVGRAGLNIGSAAAFSLYNEARGDDSYNQQFFSFNSFKMQSIAGSNKELDNGFGVLGTALVETELTVVTGDIIGLGLDALPGISSEILERVPWRQSEIDVLAQNPEYTTGEIFQDGDVIAGARKPPRGSSRPDGYNWNTMTSLEVKNYNWTIAGNINNCARSIIKQINDRIINLPSGSFQRIIVDLRGQKIENLTNVKKGFEKMISDQANTRNYRIEYLEK